MKHNEGFLKYQWQHHPRLTAGGGGSMILACTRACSTPAASSCGVCALTHSSGVR
jgi:hypothetical protein